MCNKKRIWSGVDFDMSHSANIYLNLSICTSPNCNHIFKTSEKVCFNGIAVTDTTRTEIWIGIMLHVVDTPMIAFKPSPFPLVRFLEEFLLKTVTTIWVEESQTDGFKDHPHELTDTVPPISRFYTKPIRRRGRTCVFRLSRSLRSFLLYSRE